MLRTAAIIIISLVIFIAALLSQKPKYAVLAAFVAVLGFAGPYLVEVADSGRPETTDSSVMEIAQQFSDGNYSYIVLYYNSEVYGQADLKKQIDPLISDHIKNTVANYKDESISYENAYSAVIPFVDLEDSLLSELAQGQLRNMEKIRGFHLLFLAGKEYIAKGDYLNAIQSFSEITGDSDYYNDAQNEIDECVNHLIGREETPQNVDDYLNSMSRINQALVLLPTNSQLLQYLENLYTGYENLIIEEVTILLSAEKYDEAQSLISKALNNISSDNLQQLNDSIQRIRERGTAYVDATGTVYTAAQAVCVEHRGNLTVYGQKDAYSFTAPIRGVYRFYFENVDADFRADLSIYDSAGKRVERRYCTSSDDGVTAELSAGREYSAVVEASIFQGTYTLTIGQPKLPVNISAYETVYDSIEYTDQQNEYIFIPALNGTYRFELTDIVNGFKMWIRIYDSLGYKVDSDLISGNLEGVTAQLEAGQRYTVQVVYYNSKGTYTMNIGKQQAAQDVSGQNYIRGNIKHTGQENVYIYTPYSMGRYKLQLNGLVNGFRVNLFVYDSLGYKIGGMYAMGNEDEIIVDLMAETTYRITVSQYSGSGDYEVQILQE